MWFVINQPLSGVVKHAQGVSGSTSGWLLATSRVDAIVGSTTLVGVASFVHFASNELAVFRWAFFCELLGSLRRSGGVTKFFANLFLRVVKPPILQYGAASAWQMHWCALKRVVRHEFWRIPMQTLMKLAAVAALAVPFTASAALVDFGTDPGKANDTNDLFDYPIGTFPTTNYTADTLELTINPTGAFNVFGFGSGLGTPAQVNFDGTEFLTIEAAFDGVPTADIFDIKVAFVRFNSDLGQNVTNVYRFTTQSVVPGSDPAVFSPDPIPTDGNLVTLFATTDLSNPVETDRGLIDYSMGQLEQVQIILQNGNVPGTATLVIDNIDVAPIPEPASALLGMAGIAGLALSRRR